MKKKIISNLSSMNIFLWGTITLILGISNLSNVSYLLFATLVTYGICEIINYQVNQKNLSLPLGISSIILAFILLLLNAIQEPLALSFVILVWVLFNAFSKLITINDYLQINHFLWKWQLFSFFILVFFGTFVSFILYYNPSFQVFVTGLFFYTIATIDLLFNS